MGDFGPTYHLRGGDTQLLRHSLRRIGVIPGNHDSADTGALALVNGIDSRLFGRVYHALQTDETHFLQVVVVQVRLARCQFLDCEPQGAQGVAGEQFGRGQRGLPVEGLGCPGRVQGAGAHRHDHFRGTLEQNHVLAPDFDQNRHVFGGRVERNLFEAVYAIDDQFRLGTGNAQGQLGGITGAALAAEVGVVAVEATFQQSHQRGILSRVGTGPIQLEFAFDIIAGTGHRVDLATGPDTRYRHAIFGKSAGLVRADDRCGSQGFSGGQFSDQRFACGHDHARQCQDGGHEGR